MVSNAYIKSPTAGRHKGLFRRQLQGHDPGRVLAPEMWAELFLENKDNLMSELDILLEKLTEYRDAMARDDLPGLVQLLDEGRRRKEEVDGH